MSNHVHICQFCEGRYPGTTLLVEIDDRGNCACECLVKDECPGCSEHGACEKCGQAPAGDERKPFLCTPCADDWEANYSGPDEADYGGGAAEAMSRAYDAMEARRR